MTFEYSQVELIMMPPGQKDDSYQVAFVLPDDFNEEWKEILLLSRSESN